MINITCTSCKKVLSIDDAFAGGVCRCQFCGTIQTVPAKASSQKAIAGAAKGSKTLFENKARSAGAGSGSGLDDLADVVQSSGLSDSRLRKQPPSPPPRPTNLMPLLGLAAAVIIVLLVVVLVLVFRGSASPKGSSAPEADSAVPDRSAAANPAHQEPSFCGVPINQPVVVYVMDNGSSSAEVLDPMESAMFKSIESLGPDRQFQVLFWNPQTETYPTARQPAFAVKDNIEAARKRLQDVTAAGSTDPLPSLQRALADDPGQIMLITAKAGDLDDSLVDQVMKLRGRSNAKIDCFAVNGVPGDKVLARIASATRGVFVTVSEAQLKGFAE
ncbi:MAG: hypothetical protein ABSB74_02905 [Tepidisphaeraceae bacterium]